MEVKAITRNARISASKGRDLARAVQGKSLAVALKTVDFSPRKAARVIAGTLRSAAANASNNNGLDPEKLTVLRCTFDEGASMRRFWPRARGSASPIEKQTSHVTVVLTDGIQ